jgi:two-component system nitrogen regulation response regulator GlnG
MYLDEVGDMGPELQPKLLRVLQERHLERIGGSEAIPVDVRVVAATNRELETLIRDGRFREDLYYRLNVVTLTLPPLRERIEDVPFLVDHFLAKYEGELGERALAAEALERLMSYSWPGNVRELENVIQHAMVMASGGVILPEHLPVAPGPARPPVAEGTLEQLVEQKLAECIRGLGRRESANLYDLLIGLVERPLLRAVLRETGGNQLRAAALLGINRNTLRKKLRQLGLAPGGGGD